MKLAFSTLLWTSRVGPQHHVWLERLAAAGYDGVEIPVLEGGPDEYAALARLLQRLGLTPIALGSFGRPEANPVADDAALRDAAWRETQAMLERSAALGAGLLVGPLHSALYHFTWHPPSDTETERALAYHRRLGDAAAALGMQVALEPLNRYECYLLNTLAQLDAHLAALAHPAVRGMADTFHANIEERSVPAALAAHAGCLAYVQLAESDRGSPLGEGHLDWRAIFDALRRAGYDGWLAVEAFGHFEPEIAGGTMIWRPFAESPQAVYEGAARFVRQQWALSAAAAGADPATRGSRP